MLLPGAVLHADYSGVVRDFVARHFSHSQFVAIGERIFPEASEETVVLLASDRLPTALVTLTSRDTQSNVQRVDSVRQLAEQLRSWRAPPQLSMLRSNCWFERVADYKMALIGVRARRLLEALFDDSRVFDLGRFANVRIGTVTGANRFFVRRLEDIPAVTGIIAAPIVRTSAWLRTPRFTKRDFTRLSDQGERSFLLAAVKTMVLDESPEFARSVRAAEEDRINERHQCQLRDPWWSITDLRPPNVFLPYMMADTPRLIANDMSALCTNAVHRVQWKDGTSAAKGSGLVASSWTTLHALSAELVGRNYGGGVLKIEPTAARSLVVVDVGRRDDLDDLDGIRRGADVLATRTRADTLVLGDLGLDRRDQTTLSIALNRLRRARVSGS